MQSNLETKINTHINFLWNDYDWIYVQYWKRSKYLIKVIVGEIELNLLVIKP